jgi:hypothetical protein
MLHIRFIQATWISITYYRTLDDYVRKYVFSNHKGKEIPKQASYTRIGFQSRRRDLYITTHNTHDRETPQSQQADRRRPTH